VPQTSLAISPTDLKTEIGTLETEKALNLSAVDRKELQQRLAAISFDAGPPTGAFSDKTRAAIAAWQKKHELTPTSWLGPLQLVALKSESESAYRGFLAALPPATATPAAPASATRTVPVVRKAQMQKPRERAPGSGRGPGGPGENSAASAAAGAFFGGVASGLIMRSFNH
jgi:peptidoglycan hydrolase-like protein with peptidoglycan-binding domain